jgi:hypothetical protein
MRRQSAYRRFRLFSDISGAAALGRLATKMDAREVARTTFMPLTGAPLDLAATQMN